MGKVYRTRDTKLYRDQIRIHLERSFDWPVTAGRLLDGIGTLSIS
jgi:hypothetical protein